MGSAFTIRPFASIGEFKECVRFQEETWGEGFSGRVPVAILKVSQRLGGIAAGAFDAEGALAGFVFGMPGVQEGQVVHWSDMLAVRPELQDVGLGARLKAYQREELVSRGVMRMHWTFDPLEAKNAHFSLNKLGAVAGEYVRDMYGRTDPASGSDQGAQPTFGVLREGDFNLPGEPDLAVDADQLLVLIPDSIQALRDTSLEGIM